MIWLSLDTSREYGSLYESGEYHIRHYTERDSLGFGIVCARAYFRSEPIGQWTGARALELAQAACERHASPIAELDFVAGMEARQ